MDNDIIVPPSQTQGMPESEMRKFTMIVYALYAASMVVLITVFIGLVVAYVKRNDMRGSIYYDHMQYLIKTFWVSLAGFAIGYLTVILGIGFVVLLVVTLWFVYRVVAGFLKLYDGKTVSPTGWF